MKMQWVFTFGKHKGRAFSDVLSESPSYVHWCACNMPWFKDALKRDEPDIFNALKESEKALRSERDAWAYTGGRLPSYDGVFWKVKSEIAGGRHRGRLVQRQLKQDAEAVEHG